LKFHYSGFKDQTWVGQDSPLESHLTFVQDLKL